MTATYTPTKLDIEWCRLTLDLLRDGGTWAFPAAGWSFQVDKTKLELTLISGDPPDSSDFLKDLWVKTVATFAEFHYTVINGLPTDKDDRPKTDAEFVYRCLEQD